MAVLINTSKYLFMLSNCLKLLSFLLFYFSTAYSQTNKAFIKNDSALKSNLEFINNALHIYINLLNAEDAVDRARDEANRSGRLLADRYYPLFFDKYFTLLSFEKDGLPDGNSASLKTSSNETKLNLNLSYKKLFTIINIGADLNLSSNTGSIFSGGDLTANSTYYLKFSFLKSEMNKLKYDFDRRNGMRIKREYKMNEITQEFNSHYVIKYSAILKQLRIVDSTINVLYDKQTTNQNRTLNTADETQLIKLLEEN
ncbi:MAG: hypothetical protein HC867_01415 [Bacteroidia bacterium]|nr:hypothetical protein [Bacteroidia bacterium]